MKVRMKLSKRTKSGIMHFGRHIINMEFKDLELNESEIADLKNEGPKYWFEMDSENQNEPAPKRRGRPKKVVE